MITDAVAAKLAGDATLAGLLSSFAGVPAVFTARPVPEGATAPFLLTEGSVADVAEDTLRRFGRRITRDISIWFPADDDPTNLETAAERVRTLFHKQPLAVAGHHHVMTLASGPVPAPDSGDERGRVVTIQVVVQQS
jgi:hypothetical protein